MSAEPDAGPDDVLGDSPMQHHDHRGMKS
jgi:hypothetical protein